MMTRITTTWLLLLSVLSVILLDGLVNGSSVMNNIPAVIQEGETEDSSSSSSPVISMITDQANDGITSVIDDSTEQQEQQQEEEEPPEQVANTVTLLHLRGLKTKSSMAQVEPYEEKLHVFVEDLADNDWTLQEVLTCVVIIFVMLCLICCIFSCMCNILCGGPCCCDDRRRGRRYRGGYYDGYDRGGGGGGGCTICGLSMCDILACICIYEICCDNNRGGGNYLSLP